MLLRSNADFVAMQAARANPAEHPEQRWGRGVGTPRVTHITLELILDRGLVKFIFTKGDKPNEKAVTFHFNSWLPDGCLLYTSDAADEL